MRTLLLVGREHWVCADAATPAKIADLLARCKPVNTHYLPRMFKEFVLEEAAVGAYPHEVKIETLAADRKVHTPSAMAKLEAVHDTMESQDGKPELKNS